MMGKRLITRLVWGALTMLGTSVVTFSIAFLIPGDPAKMYAGEQADEETVERIRQEMGLDQPVPVQYLRYVGRVLQGDLGESLITHEPVLLAIWRRFPVTALLALGGLFCWLLLGIPAGLLTARYRDTPVDRTVLVLAMIGISIPTFWLGRVLQYELAYARGWFPVGGYRGLPHLILPCLTLGLVGAGYYARLVHSNLVETLHQDYIRTARAKGLPEWIVLFKHALRNAFIPILTIIGLDAAALLSGVVFTETVFALPGIGAQAVQAIFNLDVPLIMGTVLFSAGLVVLVNLVIDLIYPWVDPRIKGGV